jgi:gamma-glutamylcyclotransferase (GGCT)/AIG2-like uncharacterized protein YtfP
MTLLFVYGTLRDPAVRAFVLGRALPAGAVSPARARGFRAVTLPGRSYPALVAGPGDAEGDLLCGLSAADLARLDRFEGDEYVRRPLEVTGPDGALIAEAFWPAFEVSPDAPPWRLEEWASRHKAAFLAAEVASPEGPKRNLSHPPSR